MMETNGRNSSTCCECGYVTVFVKNPLSGSFLNSEFLLFLLKLLRFVLWNPSALSLWVSNNIRILYRDPDVVLLLPRN